MHLNARTDFQLRSLKNWAVCITMFIFVAGVAAQFAFRWYVDLAAIGVAVYVLFAYLEKQAIVITCPSCAKSVATNTPWVCGFCRKDNSHPDEFPFVHQCEHCSAQPKAYQCHHTQCGAMIFLSADEQEQNFAYCLNAAPAAAPPPPKPSDERKDAREQVLHAIEMADLQAKLEAIKQRADLGRAKPTRERIKEVFEKDMDTWLGVEDEAEAQRAIVRERYKDNPQKLQKALDVIEAFLHKHTPGTDDNPRFGS